MFLASCTEKQGAGRFLARSESPGWWGTRLAGRFGGWPKRPAKRQVPCAWARTSLAVARTSLVAALAVAEAVFATTHYYHYYSGPTIFAARWMVLSKILQQAGARARGSRCHWQGLSYVVRGSHVLVCASWVFCFVDFHEGFWNFIWEGSRHLRFFFFF